MQIENGSTVTLHFTLSLAAGGRVVETTRDGAPARIVLGESDLHQVFEQCLLGLTAGETRRFEIASRDAYGALDGEDVHVLPRADFPADMELAPDHVVSFTLPSGEEVPGTVVAVSEHEVEVDFSHPLAGHDLVFEVEILDVAAPAG